MARLCPFCGILMLLQPKLYHRGYAVSYEVYKCPKCFRTARGIKVIA